MKFLLKHHTIILFCLVSALFLFLRLYRLADTMNFFGDIGRDFLVMQRWQVSKIPPLLGPQTSLMSFNQSSVYFYLLFPFYLLTSTSEISTTIAVCVYYLLFFVLLMVMFKKHQGIQYAIISLLLLIAVWPGLVIQHREVWNPSFIPIGILLAVFSWIKGQETNFSKKIFALISFGLAFSVSLSYASFPVVLTLLILIFFFNKSKQRFLLLLYFFLFVFLFNIPTLFFEVRHGFLLTKSVFAGDGVHFSFNLSDSIQSFFQYFFYSKKIISLLLLFFVVFIGFYTYLKSNKQKNHNLYATKFLLIGFIASSILLLISPFSLFEHFLPASITLFLLLIVFIPKLGIWLTIIFVSWFLQPNFVSTYFMPTTFTIKNKQTCIAQLCSAIDSSVFINLNSGSHNHQAYEYVFLANKDQCQAVSIDRFEIASPEYMAVISEGVTYDFDKTDYYEISVFGDKNFLKEINCLDMLTIHIFEKIDEI